LVFITQIYHDAQSTECVIPAHTLSKVIKNLKVMSKDWIKICWPKTMVHWIVGFAVLFAMTCNGVSRDWCMGSFTQWHCKYRVSIKHSYHLVWWI